MKTMTRVYDTYDQAGEVVTALEALGIAHQDISIIANKSVSDMHEDVEDFDEGDVAEGAGTGAGIGAALGGGAGLLAGLGILAIPGLGPVVAAGWLAATALGAVGGAVAGGIVGTLVGLGVSQEDAHVYAETVRRGGTMVSVRYEEAKERMVAEAMDRHDPIDAARRRQEYLSSGWTGTASDTIEHESKGPMRRNL